MDPASTTGQKLDLSRLTDEEAKHVWEVLQRDMDLRKKEEDRLGELKTKLEKEDSKRELLGSESSLTDSHCIRCLQRFKFLVNSRRQCLDCQLYVCKACSRYDKKDHCWVCDPCRMARVLKIGTWGWYHDHVRSRFKYFGSVKVMNLLQKRLNGKQGVGRDVRDGCEDNRADASDVKSYRRVPEEQRGQGNQSHSSTRAQNRSDCKKNLERSTEVQFPKHRMTKVPSPGHPLSSQQFQGDMDASEEEEEEEGGGQHQPTYPLPLRRHGQASSQENVSELNKRILSVEGLLSCLELKMGISTEQPEFPSAVELEEDHLRRKLGELVGNISDKGLSSSSEEDVRKAPAPKKALVKSDVSGETALASSPLMSSSSDEQLSEAQKRSSAAALCDITTEVLRTINATESAMTEFVLPKPNHRHQLTGTDAKQADEAYRKLEEGLYMTAGKTFGLEKKLRSLEESARSGYSVTTDSELSELEDKVALASALVHNTESEVTDIENRIATLNPAVEKSKVKASLKHRRRLSSDFPTKTNSGSGPTRKPSSM